MGLKLSTVEGITLLDITGPVNPDAKPKPKRELDSGLYDVDGAAAYLGVPRRTLLEWSNKKRIRCSKLNYRDRRFRKADLDSFLDRIAVGGKA
jgi:excisionase family DNA binding protein